jgi:hypothetical protein
LAELDDKFQRILKNHHKAQLPTGGKQPSTRLESTDVIGGEPYYYIHINDFDGAKKTDLKYNIFFSGKRALR